MQGWEDMLNWGLCHSFPGLCRVPLGAASCCSSAVPMLMAWVLGLLQKHPSILTMTLLWEPSSQLYASHSSILAIQ